jgi:hypothetical protein
MRRANRRVFLQVGSKRLFFGTATRRELRLKRAIFSDSGGSGDFGFSAMPSLFHKKIAYGPFLLPGIAAKASRNKILKTIVAAFRNRSDVIQRDGEPGKLLFAIAAPVGITFVHFDAVLANVVKVEIGGGNFRLRFHRRPFRAEFSTRLNFVGDQDTIQRPVSVRFAILSDCAGHFKRPNNLTKFILRYRVLDCGGVCRLDDNSPPQRLAESDVRSAILGDGMPESIPVEGRFVGRKERLKVVYNLLDDGGKFESGEITICDRCPSRLRLGFEIRKQLPYLFQMLFHFRASL